VNVISTPHILATDNVEAGRMGARTLGKLLAGKGKAAVVMLVPGAVSTTDSMNTARAFGLFREQTSTSFSGEIPPLAEEIDLLNYPNPFNGRTIISFNLPDGGIAEVRVYDVLGREVSRLYSGYLSSGFHQYAWPTFNEQAPTSGTYYYRVTINDRSDTGKMMYLK
jgi:hypothetical protein